MKKLLLILLMSLSLSSYAQNSSQFYAINTDSSLSSMIQRWSKENNAVIYWDNNVDFEISDVDAFNEKLDLSHVRNLTDAVIRITKFIQQERPNLVKLQVCVYHTNQELTLAVRPLYMTCD